MSFSGLIWALQLDEASGHPSDFTATGGHGTITGSVAHAAGKLSNGLTFTAGAGNYVNIPDQSKLRLFRNTTINFWVYLNSYTNGCILSKASGTFPAGVRTEATGSKFYVSEGGANKLDLSTWVTTGSWHMITITHDATTGMVGFVNGTQRATGTSGFFWMGEAAALPWRVGAPDASFYNSGTAASDMKIDEIYAFDRVLSGAEITALYNAGVGLQASPDTGLRINPQQDRTLVQRTKNTTTGLYPLTGTYTAGLGTPERITVTNYLHATTTEDAAATDLINLEVANGVWSGDLPMDQNPTDGWVNFVAKSYDSDGTLLATSPQTFTRSGVGILTAWIGQSNAYRIFDPYDYPTPSDSTCTYVAGKWLLPEGDGIVTYLTNLQEKTGVLVGAMNYAVAGTGIVYEAGSGTWSSLTAGQPLPVFLAALEAVGGDIELVHIRCGEADSLGEISKSVFQLGLITLIDRIRAATPRRGKELPIIIGVMATLLDGNDLSTSVIRDALITIIDEDRGLIAGGNAIDAPRADFAHYDPEGYVELGYRDSWSALYALGLSNFNARGPRITAVSVTGTSQVTLTVDLDGNGTSLKETDGTTDGGSLTGFQISANRNFSSPYTISSTAFSGTTIQLNTSQPLPVNGLVWVRYMYGMVPTITNVVYNNLTALGDSLGFPLLPLIEMSSLPGVNMAIGQSVFSVDVFRSIDLDEGTAEVIKAGPGTLFGLWITNLATTTRFVKIYNRTTATAGTHTPVITIPVPGNTSDDVLAALGVAGSKGIYFDTGICIAATTGVADNDTGAPSANDVVVNAFFL